LELAEWFPHLVPSASLGVRLRVIGYIRVWVRCLSLS
jgi:hypothetical protein